MTKIKTFGIVNSDHLLHIPHHLAVVQVSLPVVVVPEEDNKLRNLLPVSIRSECLLIDPVRLLVDAVCRRGDPVMVDEDGPAVVGRHLWPGPQPQPQPRLPWPGGSICDLPALDPGLALPPPATHLLLPRAVDSLRPDRLLRLFGNLRLRGRKTTATAKYESVPAGSQVGPVGECAKHGVHADPSPAIDIALPAGVATGEGGEDALHQVAVQQQVEEGRAEPGQPCWHCHHLLSEGTHSH